MTEMAQLLTTKPDDPSLVSRTHVVQEEDQARTHMIEGENWFFQDIFWLCYCGLHTGTRTHTDQNDTIIFLLLDMQFSCIFMRPIVTSPLM